MSGPPNHYPDSSRVYLTVPFSQKEFAKAHGARWDPDNRLWFVTNKWCCGPLMMFVPNEVRSIIEPELLERQRQKQLNQDWSNHPPRYEDAWAIWKTACLTHLRPIKTNGFCGGCDTYCTDTWFASDEKVLVELEHLSCTNGPLYPKEVPLIIEALESGRIKNMSRHSNLVQRFLCSLRMGL